MRLLGIIAVATILKVFSIILAVSCIQSKEDPPDKGSQNSVGNTNIESPANSKKTLKEIQKIYILNNSDELKLTEGQDFTAEIILGAVGAAVLLGGGSIAMLSKNSDVRIGSEIVPNIDVISKQNLPKKSTNSITQIPTLKKLEVSTPRPSQIVQFEMPPVIGKTDLSISKRSLGIDSDQDLSIKIVKSSEEIEISDRPVFVAFKGKDSEFRGLFSDGFNISRKASKDGFSVFEVAKLPKMETFSRSKFISEELLTRMM